MPKKFFKKYMPHPERIKNHKHLRVFGEWIHASNLWHLNRYSVAWAFSIGLFCAFMPIPFQMVLAATFAIIIRANLPISVALVWVTNPITMPPIFYMAYKIGAIVLQKPQYPIDFALSIHWLTTQLGLIWKPFLLGCLICGVASAVIAHGIIRLMWRIHVGISWRRRQNGRRN